MKRVHPDDEAVDLIAKVNAIYCDGGGEWFVCTQCNKLVVAQRPDYLETSKWGRERPFCYDCVRYCDECDVYYCDSMAYRHERCVQAEASVDFLASSSESDEVTVVTAAAAAVTPPLTINDALMRRRGKPAEPEHSWLRLESWGEPNKNGNYTRPLGKGQVTVYRSRHHKWHYVYDGDHSTSYDSLESVIAASYAALRTEIRQLIPL